MLTATGVVGAGLAGSFSIARAAAKNNDLIRVALIGCGGRGTGAADQTLSVPDSNVKLVAMADAFADRLKGSLGELKSKHSDKVDVPADRQFVGLDAYKKAIEQADLVVLATPPGFRPVHFEAAVNAGKNVFMEKPVCVDAAGAARCSPRPGRPTRRSSRSSSAFSAITRSRTASRSSGSTTAPSATSSRPTSTGTAAASGTASASQA